MLYGPEMSAIMQKVGQAHQLHIDQIDLLNAETGQVMLGFVEPKDYSESLMESLRVDRMTADAIAQDVNDQLFAKIRESMQQVHELAAKEKEEMDTEPPAVTALPIVAPKLLEPTAADIMLTQKTITAPVPLRHGGGAASVNTQTLSTIAPTPTPTNTSYTPAPVQLPPTTPQERPKYRVDPYHEPVE